MADIRDEVNNWLQSQPLADTVVDELKDQLGREPTLEEAQQVWLRFLEVELHSGLQSCVERLVV